VKAVLTQRRTWFGAEMFAAALALGAVAVLSLILFVNPPVAHWLTIEDGVVEWMQVTLDAAAVALIGRHLLRDSAEGGRSPLDVLTVAALIGLIIGELDVDRRLFGTKVISTAFFFKAKYALPWRLLAALVVVGVPAAVGLYVLRHVMTLWRAGWSALAQPWGRVLAASAVVLALTEIFERPLGHVPGVPHFFVEETLELVASIGICVAAAAHPPSRPGRPATL
jgi:hypothetical protein